MRTRTLIAGAAFLAVAGGAGQVSAQVLSLRGSDTLDTLTAEVIAACPAVGGAIVYSGGGSTLGQASMVAGTQHVSPMSRELNGSACTNESRELLIALDGLSVVTKNSTHTNTAGGTCTDDIGTGPLALTGVPDQFVLCTSDAQCAAAGGTTCNTTGQYCNIGGSIAGCTADQGCNPAGTYTFNTNNADPSDDWKDVLRVIYGGMMHGNPVTGTVPGTFINVPQASNDPNTFNADGTYICRAFTLSTAGACTVAADCPVRNTCVAGACSITGLACTVDADCARDHCDGGLCKVQVPGNTDSCVRNPARIDCASPVRGVLLANYSQVIQSPVCTLNATQTCTVTADCPQGQSCTGGVCVAPNRCKLKHAFRRDDLSGTTDAFQALVGLVSVPGFTTLRSKSFGVFAPEVADFGATAGPFCNAGTQAQNKGFSDGLDLDPYRRACNAALTADRTPYESVCQPGATPNNSDLNCYVNATGQPTGARPANYQQTNGRERTSPQGRGFLPAGFTDTAGTVLQSDIQGTTPAGLATRQRCLGVVQPISIPQEVSGQTVVSQWGYLPSNTPTIAGSVPPGSLSTTTFPALGGGICNTTGARGVANALPGRIMVCPDGGLKPAGGNCRLPINNSVSPNRFDCLYDSWAGGALAVTDPRAFNLMPVNNLGNMSTILDNYQNPNYPTVTQLRRFARRLYGVHMIRPDNSKKTAPGTLPCRLATDTTQIGCLVKTSPCSIGFAGREAADEARACTTDQDCNPSGSTSPSRPCIAGQCRIDNLSLRVQGIQPTNANVELLLTNAPNRYPIARALWFNSFQQSSVVGFMTPNLSAAEQALSTCMGLPKLCSTDADCNSADGVPPCRTDTGRCTFGTHSVIDTVVSNVNFIPVPAGTRRFWVNTAAPLGCPLTFPAPP